MGLRALLQKLVGYVLIPVYTRFLDPEDYGVLAMLMIVQTLVEIGHASRDEERCFFGSSVWLTPSRSEKTSSEWGSSVWPCLVQRCFWFLCFLISG